jgi:hypothetical protein
MLSVTPLVYAIFSRIPSSSMVNIRISKTYSEGDWLFSVSSTRYFMAAGRCTLEDSGYMAIPVSPHSFGAA